MVGRHGLLQCPRAGLSGPLFRFRLTMHSAELSSAEHAKRAAMPVYATWLAAVLPLLRRRG
jgi:hypothetical protein